MNTLGKIMINFNEEAEAGEFVTAVVYNMEGEVIFTLPNIRKHENALYHPITWKRGLRAHYEGLARKGLQSEYMQFIHI